MGKPTLCSGIQSSECTFMSVLYVLRMQSFLLNLYAEFVVLFTETGGEGKIVKHNLWSFDWSGLCLAYSVLQLV